MSIKIKWLSVASFEIDYAGHHIVTDPFITPNEQSPCTWKDVEDCEIITLSHAHYDHISDIPELMNRFDPLLLCGERTALPLSKWVNCNPMSVYPMYPDLELDFGWVRIKALYGVHVPLKGRSSEINEWLGQFEKIPGLSGIGDLQEIANVEYRNYLFTFDDGFRVLMWGNSFTQVQKSIVKDLKPDLAILQATGQADDPDTFADFASLIGAGMVIPHHQDLNRDKGFWAPRMKALEESINRINPSQHFIIPQYGEWMEV